MQLRQPVLVFILCMGQFSCTSVRPQEIDFTRFSPDERSFAINSGLERAEEIVIRDPMSWEEVWTRIHSIRIPVPSLPEVDFQRNVVVIVALGQMTSGGFSIVISAAAREGMGTVVSVLERQPGPSCLVTTSITSPVDIAVLPKTAEPVQFRRLAETTGC